MEDYLVVSVTAGSLAEGQTKALTEITERIIQSVASNVTVSKKNTLSEVNVNGIIESSDAFTQISRIKSANLPFLKGISLSTASAKKSGPTLSSAANANVAKMRTKKANKVAVKRMKLAGKLLADNKKDAFYNNFPKGVTG